MLYAYPGDVLTFLDDAIRTLEAIEAIARVEGEPAIADRAAQRSVELSG